MREVVQLGIYQFSAVYLLLIVVLAIMKRSKINQTKLLIVASFRMTVQLVLAGLVLTYIFENRHPLFTALYLTAMIAFSIKRTLGKSPVSTSASNLPLPPPLPSPDFPSSFSL
jgi:putative ABC transport system permease protein